MNNQSEERPIEAMRQEFTPAPLFSIIILIRDFDHLVPLTVDSILAQAFDSYEIIIMEHECSVHILEMLEELSEKITHMESAKDGSNSFMMNQSLILAKGKYIQFLQPGDRFLSRHALSHMAGIIQEKEPDFLYAGYLQREEGSPPIVITLPMSLSLLRKGELPTRMQSCWFLRDALKKLEGFDQRYEDRPGLDILCRLVKMQGIKIESTKHIMTDYEYRKRPTRAILHYALETYLVIHRNFGFIRGIVWWFIQDHFRMVRSVFRSIKQAFWKA